MVVVQRFKCGCCSEVQVWLLFRGSSVVVVQRFKCGCCSEVQVWLLFRGSISVSK